MQIRDTRNGSWHWVNNAVISCPHINPYDKIVYSALCTFGGFTEIRPSFKIIAKRASVSERRTKEAILNLIKQGIVEKIQGGGRGRANVYELLKVPKGCKSCTVSKGCKIEQETVQVTTVKGAQLAPHIDREVDIVYIATANADAPFNLEKEIKKLKTDKLKHIQLIGEFLEEKKIPLASKAELKIAISRHLRAATKLAKFSDNRIGWATTVAEKEYPDNYTLETLVKILTR